MTEKHFYKLQAGENFEVLSHQSPLVYEADGRDEGVSIENRNTEDLRRSAEGLHDDSKSGVFLDAEEALGAGHICPEGMLAQASEQVRECVPDAGHTDLGVLDDIDVTKFISHPIEFDFLVFSRVEQPVLSGSAVSDEGDGLGESPDHMVSVLKVALLGQNSVLGTRSRQDTLDVQERELVEGGHVGRERLVCLFDSL